MTQPVLQQNVFTPGETVIYGIHGKGTIVSVLKMNMGGIEEEFYKVKIESKLSKMSDVLVPKKRASEMGLRRPLVQDDVLPFFSQMAELVEVDISGFDWEKEEKQIQALIGEGKLGLAKAVSRLHQTLRAMPVPEPLVETTYKTLRSMAQVEITHALKKHHKNVRDMINDALGGDYSRPARRTVLPKAEKLFPKTDETPQSS